LENNSVESADSPVQNVNPVAVDTPVFRTDTNTNDTIAQMVKSKTESSTSNIGAISIDMGNSEIQKTLSREQGKKKFVTALILLLILGVLGVGGWYVYLNYFKVTPVVTLPPAPRVYTLKDIWPDSQDVLLYTGVATSGTNYMYAKITDFDNLYSFLNRNETLFTSLAQDLFGYESLNDFSDVSVNNISMRLSDGNDGPLVWGTVGRDYLLVTNSILDFLNISAQLNQSTNQ
jgi:hypothetical protein